MLAFYYRIMEVFQTMSTYNARVPADQQYQLIMECRSSGLTDYQWCKEHGIHPGTFYNWVSRLRKKACYDIPDPVSREYISPPAVQEVVRLDLGPKTDSNPGSVLSAGTIQEIPEQQAPLAAVIEISLGRATIRIANGTEPAMLDRILSLVKGSVC